MIQKHPFKVCQIWKSKEHPEQDFIIYETIEYDGDSLYDSNLWSFVLTAKINEIQFKNKIAKTFKCESYEDIKRDSIYPFSWFGEFKISSLKKHIKKYSMYLAENDTKYDITTYYKIGDLSIRNYIEPSYEELYRTHSTYMKLNNK